MLWIRSYWPSALCSSKRARLFSTFSFRSLSNGSVADSSDSRSAGNLLQAATSALSALHGATKLTVPLSSITVNLIMNFMDVSCNSYFTSISKKAEQPRPPRLRTEHSCIFSTYILPHWTGLSLQRAFSTRSGAEGNPESLNGGFAVQWDVITSPDRREPPLWQPHRA